MGILPVRATPMDGQRVGQPLPFGQPRSANPRGQPPAAASSFNSLGKRELDLTE